MALRAKIKCDNAMGRGSYTWDGGETDKMVLSQWVAEGEPEMVVLDAPEKRLSSHHFLTISHQWGVRLVTLWDCHLTFR